MAHRYVAASASFFAFYSSSTILKIASDKDSAIRCLARTGKTNEGPVKCNPSNAQSYTEGWSFKSDATRFMIKGKDWRIVQLNKTTFVISTVVLLGTGETITFTKI